MANKKKINKMSTNEKITAVQHCLRVGDTSSVYFTQLNNALPEHYRIK
ncbi:MAG: hypothetical protein JSV32_06505 [Dehalococcoidia bacterium]|nr:MAG: hypothetical protein JSV32_06505 [Dehalococcoidia bacterium]